MNWKSLSQRLFVVSMLVTILIVVQAGASPDRGAFVDEHWFQIMISNEEYLQALLAHDIDMGGVPLPQDLPTLIDAGFTITTTERIGYTFVMENNRVWPFGTYYGNPDTDAEYERTRMFRKAISRLIPKDECVGLYAPLMGGAEWWVPPGQAFWRNPEQPAATFDPMTAIGFLDDGGFVAGATPNPYYDSELEWSSPTLRIDPVMGGNVEFEYYSIGPVEAPTGWEMAQLMTEHFRKAGITVDLVAGTWLGMVFQLTNEDLYDYEMMTGVGIVWGTTSPKTPLYGWTYSQNLPLWNFASMNISAMDAKGDAMMSTLNLDECQQIAYDIQELLNYYEPYYPMLLWNDFIAHTGPYEAEPGLIGIVNYAGRNPIGSGNVWGKMLGRADRVDPARPTVDINKWGLGAYLDTLNPLTADTVPDWQVLTNLFEGTYSRNPYTLDYNWGWGADVAPTIEYWVGPGREQIDGNGVYDAPFNGTHYNGIPVTETTPGDMVNDDQVGMVITWKINPGRYWQDSDPGADLIFGTGDDGVVHEVTAEDFRFGWDLLKAQNNIRYYDDWAPMYAVEVVDAYTAKFYSEQRYLFAFEFHDSGMLTPKHVWEPWINPTISVDAKTLTRPDGSTGLANVWTDYERHHHDWFGWEWEYMPDPIDPTKMLTYLIGDGPFVYHLGGWEPGVSAHFESNKAYFGRHVCQGDIDFDQKVEDDDWHAVMASFGEYGDANFDVKADICWPSQIVTLDEVYEVQYYHFGHYWGPDPVPPGFVECP